MGRIQVLTQETINQIAAGEVIERPSSVVKELLENAIDSGASSVSVEIKDGGVSLIRVTDNGCGIEPEDIRSAFLPHATSKIRTAQDLWRISSLGFRGEALSSIAAVAQVELLTRSAGQVTGFRYVIEGGEEKSLTEVGAPAGTTVLVRNLFFRAPVRRKFLKSAVTEAGYIFDMVSHIALSRPDISFRFIQNGQTKLFTSGNHNLRDIVYSVYGREAVAELLPVEREADGMRISGFLGKPSVSRGNRSFENCFVNGRFVRCDIISRALEDAYKPYLMQHRFPFTVFLFDTAPEDLDVNVHPSKMEMRFREPEKVYRFITETVGAVLSGRELLSESPLEKEEEAAPEEVPSPEPFEERRRAAMQPAPSVLPPAEDILREEEAHYGIRQEAEKEARASLKEMQPSFPQPGPREKVPARPIRDTVLTSGESQGDLFSERILTPEKRHEFTLIGQVFRTYWLVEYKNELLIVDQHAAHEKVLYERLMRRYREKEEIPVQRLAPPLVLSLSPLEARLLEENAAAFEKAGFEIEPFGGRDYTVSAVPADFSRIEKKDWILEMIDGLTEEGGAKDPDILLDRIASMSCKAAVKGNTRLSREEMEALLSEMLEADQPYTCPHGRPTVIRISEYEMEKKFKRILS